MESLLTNIVYNFDLQYRIHSVLCTFLIRYDISDDSKLNIQIYISFYLYTLVVLHPK